ncbi:MAG: phytoene/squalene synthase family protein [Phycisphaerales bacterium]
MHRDQPTSRAHHNAPQRTPTSDAAPDHPRTTHAHTDAAPSTPSIEAAYKRCADIVRREARNFYFGLRLTPQPRRDALYAVYSWMRSADDLVDDPTAPITTRQARLDAFRAATEAILDARAAAPDAAPTVVNAITRVTELQSIEPEVWRAIAHVLANHPVDRADVIAMLDGLENDLETDSAVFSGKPATTPMPVFETREELIAYCDAVASTVGRICITIWGLRPGQSLEHARQLATARGLAFQLTNILRDFAADYDDYRIYLAEEDFHRFDISPEQLRNFDPPDKALAMLRDYIEFARSAYERSRGLSAMISADCVPTLWTMTRIYRSLLERIAENPAAAAQRTPVSIPTWRKAAIAMRAMFSPRALLL